MVDANVVIDWNRCTEDLRAKLPEVTRQLEERISQIYQLDIYRLIELRYYPPRIEVRFLPTGIGQEREYDKKKQELADVIAEIAQIHDLRPKSGISPPPMDMLAYAKERNRRVWVNTGREFTLKPYYKNYSSLKQ